MKMADYCITEAGFGADLGAEKFFDIKCRKAGLTPDAVVLVATIRALKYNGGVAKADLGAENLEALKKGIVNLEKHIENLQKYGVPVVVTLNSFITDSEAETAYVREFCETRGCEFALSEVWEKGGEGGIALAEKVLKAIDEKENHFHVLYENELSLQDKIKKIAQEIYGASDVVFAPAAAKQLKRLTELGFGDLPVCMAKNQYSLSDDPTLLGRPSGFELNVREVYVSAGAGFVVVLTGAVMTMPGLPKAPAAYNIDVLGSLSCFARCLACTLRCRSRCRSGILTGFGGSIFFLDCPFLLPTGKGIGTGIGVVLFELLIQGIYICFI